MSVAFVFPGQGSQQVGMMEGFADHPSVRATFAEASEALGDDLWRLVQQGPADALNLTRNTQPVMLTAGLFSSAWAQQPPKIRIAWVVPVANSPTILDEKPAILKFKGKSYDCGSKSGFEVPA